MKKNVQKLVLTALFMALGVVFPMLFHVFGAAAGTVFLPMHIPVLLCGLLCGWQYGGVCGLAVPLLASLLTGAPPLFPVACAMMLELCAYGVISGLLYPRLPVSVSLVGAMLGGRAVNGLANAVLLGLAGKSYGFVPFFTASFVTCLPGIVIQLLLIPAVVWTLRASHLLVREAPSHGQ